MELKRAKAGGKWWERLNLYLTVPLVLLAMSLFLLAVSNENRMVMSGWAMAGLSSIFYCWFSIKRLIPASGAGTPHFWNYVKNSVFLMLVAYIPLMLVGYLLLLDADAAAALALITLGFVSLFALPLSWFLYRYWIKTDNTIRSLRTELGQSNAHFDFLRSQINPHFLFNSLNTIYGLALQESAIQTSSAVEKLSGMMRFMLRENMEAWIPLNREIEYLQNYISLQQLRIGNHPSVKMDVYIDDAETAGQIAPMLLIPFVENAFKHGISYKEPSYIRVSLQVKNGILEFDVANSKHDKAASETRREDEGGIGIENSRQRLQLLYGEKHELMIRESVRDYFVHLNLPVSSLNNAGV